MFVVLVVWFCYSSWLLFLISAYHSNLKIQFLFQWVLLFGGYFIVHTQFFWKILGLLWVFWDSQKIIFGFFLSFPHLEDNYAKIGDGRGRNLMCHHTLPSRLVSYRIKPLTRLILVLVEKFNVLSSVRLTYKFTEIKKT